MKSIGKVGKVQLVFPKHTYGHLALEEEIDPQPPLGLLVLASYIREKLPDIDVEIFDGKRVGESELLQKLDADVIGLSVWYSNYDSAKGLVKKIKDKNPSSIIIMGGPHATAIADRIINQNDLVDVVICGEGELAFERVLKGESWKDIPGVLFRSNDNVPFNWNKYDKVDLNSLPLFDLDQLNPPFRWKQIASLPAMSAFPLAGIRGCCRSTRCEYCSGHFNGFRSMNPERYWAQVELLNKKYNIDYFFETGDIFPPKLLKNFSNVKNNIEANFRIYSYLGYLKNNDMEHLHQFGVRVIFMGIESVLIWNNKFIRRYPMNYNMDSLYEEIDMLSKNNIYVVTSFILGLPGETDETLSANIRLIRNLLEHTNVKEITVSILIPIPGSTIFNKCTNDLYIRTDYYDCAKKDLSISDEIDYYLLSQLFVNQFTCVGYSRIYESIITLREEIGSRMAHFGSIEPLKEKKHDNELLKDKLFK